MINAELRAKESFVGDQNRKLCEQQQKIEVLEAIVRNTKAVDESFAKLQLENTELKADNDARRFAMAMSEKVEKQLREENAELKKQLEEIFQHDRKIYGKETRKLKSYIYPKNTFSARDLSLTSRTYFFIRRTESRTVSKIGSYKQFGGAYLLSDRAAAELEKARAAAEKFRGKGAIKLYLSPEQEEIIKQLNEKHK